MTTSSVPAGLRERKKARTRAAIREHAMRLFKDQGYAATTVEQIAAAADVSPSTFFRYFPTKEDVVVTDDYDPMMLASMRAQPAGMDPIEAIRAAIHEVMDTLSDEDWQRERQRQRLFADVPELRARAMQQYAETILLLGAAVAERAGLPADDFSTRVLAGAVIGAAMAGVPGGLMGSYDREDLRGLDGALRLLRAGLPLGPVDQ
jgi:AcrR family transcriptional regulator